MSLREETYRETYRYPIKPGGACSRAPWRALHAQGKNAKD
jgi:hypothetical protein